MADVVDLLYPQDKPLIMGDDDGSAPRLVVAQAYGWGWRKGQVGWVVGTGVDPALANHVIAPVGSADTGTPALQHPGTQRPGEQVPELGIRTRIGTDAEDDALTAGRSHVQTFPAAQEPTYDLDADPAPAKRGPGRPRKSDA